MLLVIQDTLAFGQKLYDKKGVNRRVFAQMPEHSQVTSDAMMSLVVCSRKDNAALLA